MLKKMKVAIATGSAFAALLAGVGVATSGFSNWNSVVNESGASLNSATVVLTAGNTNTVTAPVTNFVPGDTAESVINLKNKGTVPFSSITFGVADASPTALVGSDGLTLGIQGCSVPWVNSAASGSAPQYSCSGTTYAASSVGAVSSLLASASPAALAHVNLAAPTTSTPSENYLMFSVHLPSTAPQSLEGLTDTLTYSFTANQPTAGFIG
jgi:hypothetical protein